MNEEMILTTKKAGEISGRFLVPSYQRGYRCESAEVKRLLDDIYQSGDQDYCLQPVVVRRQGEQYELIDGQQRLTTLYLIYRYLREINSFFAEPAFSLSIGFGRFHDWLGGHRGAGIFCLNWTFAQCGNLRIDTHRDNRPMQHLLHKLGFTYCGITWLEDGTERLAFQKSAAAQHRHG